MKNKLHNELAVCGFAAVKALADMHPEKIQRLYFTPERAPVFGDACRTLAARKAFYRQVESPQELEKLAQSIHHQGVVAMIANPEIRRLDDTVVSNWITAKEHVLVLDCIGNANNLGAIIRSAAFFGIKHIVITEEDSQAQITTSTYRVAQGGLEYVNIFLVGTTVRLLRNTGGRLTRIGTSIQASHSITKLKELTAKKASLIVLGNEETGLSQDVKNNCDYLVSIPGAEVLDSLNVAQAATLFLYELSR